MSIDQMSIDHETTATFDADLTAALPHLRVYALSLTRNGDHADDLVQQAAVKALAGRRSFQVGTNFNAWLFRIQRNEFISGLRRLRPTVSLDETYADSFPDAARQESGIVLREFKNALRGLSRSKRETLLMAGLGGHDYKTVAAFTGVSVGTVKSRVSRARQTLQEVLGCERTTHAVLSRSRRLHPGAAIPLAL